MASKDPRRPNILQIVSDDLGWWGLGCAGTAEIQTPTLDSLAETGTRLTRSYCASPVCSPARASLLTGRMPSAHGVHDWIRGEAYGVQEDEDSSYVGALATTPQMFAAAGWRCGYFGKWHLGRQPVAPRGFSHWYAHRTGDGPYHGAPVWQEGRAVQEPRYLTDAITEESLRFLADENESPDPLYLAVNYTAPHSPWLDQHPPEFLSRYDDCDFPSFPDEKAHPWFSWEPGPISQAMASPRPSRVGYFAAVTAMDDAIGRLLRHLDDHALRESTVVLFTSDNGFSCGQRGIWGKGNATWPLNLWENSTRVPTILSWPGAIPAGRVLSALTSSCDVHPTLLELAGLEAPEDPLQAGVSLAGLLRDTGREERETVMVFGEYGGTRSIQSREWKYITRRGGGPEELYDLSDDPTETTNLVREGAYRPRRAELRTALTDWFIQHSTAEYDAFARPVSGRGQLRPVEPGVEEADVYYQGAAERLTGPDDRA